MLNYLKWMYKNKIYSVRVYKRHTMYQFTNDFYINLIFFNKKVINYNNLYFLFLYLNIVFK